MQMQGLASRLMAGRAAAVAGAKSAQLPKAAAPSQPVTGSMPKMGSPTTKPSPQQGTSYMPMLAAAPPGGGGMIGGGELSSAVVRRPGDDAPVNMFGQKMGQAPKTPTVDPQQAAAMLGGQANARQPAPISQQPVATQQPPGTQPLRGISRFTRKARPEQRQQQNDYMRAWGV